MDHWSYQNDLDVYVYFLATKLTLKTFANKFTCVAKYMNVDINKQFTKI